MSFGDRGGPRGPGLPHRDMCRTLAHPPQNEEPPRDGLAGRAWQRSRYQSAVTCGLVEAAAGVVGVDVMTDIIARMLVSETTVGAADWLVGLALASDADTVAAISESISEAGITA